MRESTLSVLVVDDSRDFRELMDHYLKSLPCRVRFAADGEDAVDLCMDTRFDLVIMDIIMPLMDGVDAIRVIRGTEAAQKRRPMPILALTAEQSMETSLESLGAGADRTLVKPVGRTEFVRMVCKMLGTRAPGDACALHGN